MTKKVVLALAFTGVSLALHAQNADDALRYSIAAPSGSARGQAVGGALGSLGGEVSSMYINPAAVGFFRTSDFSFTVGGQNVSNDGTYMGVKGNDNKFILNITNATLIFGGKRKKPDSKWQNFSFGLGFNRTANFNQRVYYTGEAHNSLSMSYVDQANAANITDPETELGTDPQYTLGYLAHTAVPAYMTFLINPNETNGNFNGTFYSAAQAVDDASIFVSQQSTTHTKGSNNEVNFAFGANYNDKLYLGGSVNVPVIHYEREATWQETNINTKEAALNNWQVTEFLKTDGTGVNVKLGAIVKPIKSLNIGVSMYSPSWIWFTDTYHTDMAADTKITNKNVFSSSTDSNNGYEDEGHYSLRTPWKGVVSASYLFAPSADTRKPTGFISVDYEYMDYASMKYNFRNDDGTDNFNESDRNASIKETFQAASNFRVGGELKIHVVAFRLGFATYGSPYKNSAFDGARQYYTAGVGYRNRGFYMDLTGVYGTQKYAVQPYTLAESASSYGQPELANIDNKNVSVLATFGWKF